MLRNRTWLAIAIMSLLTMGESRAQSSDEPEPTYKEVHLDSVSVDGPGTFILHDADSGERHIHNPARAKTRFVPASTFKIPNTIIALETGVADSPDFPLKRDTAKAPAKPYWPRSWKRGNTLRSAFQNSVYWYCQEIARRVGQARMQSFVDHFGYGNGNISPAVDTFWLYGDLRISPLEQVDFLRRFCGDELGVSERTTKMVQDIMVLEETEEYVLRGKTGTAEVTPTRELGWLVGYLQRDDRVWYYALNMEGERVWEEWPPRKRKDLVIRIFRALGVLTQP